MTKQKRAAKVKPLKRKNVSDVLDALPGQFSDTKVTINDLQEALSTRAYGLLLFVLALPNLIPIPAPGLSALLGLPLIFLTVQLVLGQKTPWFPAFITRRGIRASHFERLCKRAVPWVKKLERFIRPRLAVLTTPPADRFIALLCVALSLMIMLPVPFGNALPALAICLFAIGILQHDGVCVLVGLVVAAISAALVAAFVGGVAFSIDSLFDF